MSYYEKAEQSQITPICVTLIGLPGLGKSSWAQSFRNAGLDHQIISFDDLIRVFSPENMISMGVPEMDIPSFGSSGRIALPRRDAPVRGTSYQDSFSRNKVLADTGAHALAFSSRISNYQALPHNIIVDSTNVTRVKRRYIRDFFSPDVFDHYAVFFPCPSWEALCEINNERVARNRSISPEVLKIMYDTYIKEASDFPFSEEAKLYKEVMIPNFQNITNDGVFYD